MTSGSGVYKVNTGSSYLLFAYSDSLFPLRVEYKVKQKSKKLEIYQELTSTLQDK